jgi:hypothetical protein
VRTLPIETPGRIQAMNQKLNAVMRYSVTWRRTGILPGDRAESSGIDAASLVTTPG